MSGTYLIEIIRALGENGRKEASLFLASPYFNRSPIATDVRMLYKVLAQAAPDFEENQIERDRIYVQVFPNKPVVQGKLDKTMTELKKQLRLFALCEQYFDAQREDLIELDWATWLRKQGLGDKLALSLNKLKKQERADAMPGDNLLLRIAEEEYEWKSDCNDLSSDLGIPNLIRELDIYYYTYRADFSNRALLQQKADRSTDLRVLAYDEIYYAQQSPMLLMLRNAGRLFQKKKPEIEDFEQLLNLIEAVKSQVPLETLKLYYSYLRNLCTLLLDSGKLEFIPILHGIHKSNLNNGLLFDSDARIHANAYLSIVLVALRAKEISWAREVTETYKDLLVGGEQPHFFYQINRAYCHFAEGNYEKALDEIPDAPLSSYYYLMIRRLEIKAYYELSSDLLPYKIDSFRKYIERTAPKTIAENVRAMHLNFIYILNQLSQSPYKDRKRAEKILQRIEERPQLCERTWLIEKAKALK
ncbi:MAG: hypothetical protein H7246_13195 [Phycisphaerae bacterium]|nr:hypothetical protein [Saprospiraceae bacterium]